MATEQKEITTSPWLRHRLPEPFSSQNRVSPGHMIRLQRLLQLIHGGTRVQERAYGLPCLIRLASVNSLAVDQRCSSRDYAASSGGDLPGFSELEFFGRRVIDSAVLIDGDRIFSAGALMRVSR
jgi:hypothetical protein